MTHRRENRDHITGLRTRTHAGRPDWEQVRIHDRNKLNIYNLESYIVCFALKFTTRKYFSENDFTTGI